MKYLENRTFAIVDVETSGASPTGDRIIEIGILRVEEGRVVKTFNSLINPGGSISPWIERITGISTDDVRSAPTFEDKIEEIKELLDGAIFVAHNARFDYGFVKNEFKRAGIPFNAKCLCTVRLSRKMFPRFKKHDLSSVIDRFGFECENRHRAYDDAKVLWDFLVHIHEGGRGEELQSAITDLLKEHTMPQFLDAKTVKSLPEGPGVYIFYGENDEILYVGKSRNVRYRVLSHFSNDHTTSKEMHLCQETHRIEARSTAGELSALLLESSLIKELSPIYNRVLRRTSQLVIAKKKIEKRYLGVMLERVGVIDPSETKQVLGVFKNLTQAKQFLRTSALEHRLCPRVLGLEKGKGACFYSQIEKCSGACGGKEEADAYNKRVLLAFKRRRLKAWPFGGPIMITEKKDDIESHSFILDNWCLIADAKMDADSVEENQHTPKFDYDSYKIFLRYIRNPQYKKNIKRLTSQEIRAFEREYMDEPVVVIE